MESDPDIGRALFLVCDQPYISASLLEAIMHLGTSSGKAIVASQYGEILGTPVLFCRSMFDQLQRLKGDNGARKVVLANMDQVATVPFPEGAIDIDTHDNYSQVMRQFALQ
jgi:molybdenum cofactor cytidylyltransferase